MVKGVIQVGTMTGKSEGNQIKWSTGEVWTRVDQCLGCEKFVGRIQSLYEGVKSDILTKEQVESTIKTENVHEVDENKNTLLHWSCWYKKSDLTKIFLEHGVNMETLNHLNQTALQWAVTSGDIKSAKMLIDNGANVHVKDIDGYNLIMVAAQFKQPGSKCIALDCI